MSKLLLYCTKSKPYLYPHFNNLYFTKNKDFGNVNLNGKIVAECDFEVEKIRLIETPEYAGSECNTFLYDVSTNFETKTLTEDKLCKQSCLKASELDEYLDLFKEREIYGYAIHIKNLHIFDEPRELNDYIHPLISCSNYEENNFKKSFCRNVCSHNKDSERLNVWCDRNEKWLQPITKAPQNMMRVWEDLENSGILISIKPQWLCKILNGEKTIEIRKKVLKEMLKNV